MGKLQLTYKRGSSAGRTPLTKRADDVLARIAADVLALRAFSGLQAELYAQIKRQEHDARLAELHDTAASLEDQNEADFAELLVLNGDAEPGEDEDRPNIFEKLADETANSSI